jgi:hypothetical protein
MRAFLLLAGACGIAFGENIEALGFKWSVPVAADWAVKDDSGIPLLHLTVPRDQKQPRRPKQFAVAETPNWQRVTVSVEVKALEGHAIIVFAYRDDAHFNYAHLSVDQGSKQPVHNGIFHVYGGDRVRISNEHGPAALTSKDEWHKVQLTHDAATGIVAVTVNGKPVPALEAVDLSLGPGRVGLGSFTNTAMFRNLKISGTPEK